LAVTDALPVRVNVHVRVLVPPLEQLLVSVTTAPPDGAPAVNVTVPVAEAQARPSLHRPDG
jgi:hypothetical protein